MDRRQSLEQICSEHGVAAVYLFGSRAAHGVELLGGATVEGGGSDLDVGLLLYRPPAPGHLLSRLQVALEDVFAPLRVDLVPLDRVDPIFQFRAIDGERVLALAPRAADLFELEVMRTASELLPVQRALERDRFGVHTT